jgi:hypothetical protein
MIVNPLNPEDENNQNYRKQRAAAAAAVEAALKTEQNTIRAFPQPQKPAISAWQAALRSNIHNSRGNTR